MMNTTYFLKRLSAWQAPTCCQLPLPQHPLLWRGAASSFPPAKYPEALIYGRRVRLAGASSWLSALPTCGSLTVIEYDGMNLDAEGNPEIVEVLV